ncbi:hypothetical protein [Flectobacillus roseus]|uniref:hypothetical protein n=1 Tax=Flectobacillus roseus TaxID=502259 RepID=UPI0036D79B66
MDKNDFYGEAQETNLSFFSKKNLFKNLQKKSTIVCLFFFFHFFLILSILSGCVTICFSSFYIPLKRLLWGVKRLLWVIKRLLWVIKRLLWGVKTTFMGK